MEGACDEERKRRHCLEGTCVSRKALSNALDGASDRDMLFLVKGRESQVKTDSQSRRVTTKVSRH